jgi:hypothetical protein
MKLFICLADVTNNNRPFNVTNDNGSFGYVPKTRELRKPENIFVGYCGKSFIPENISILIDLIKSSASWKKSKLQVQQGQYSVLIPLDIIVHPHL